jgi:hypothetical protein
MSRGGFVSSVGRTKVEKERRLGANQRVREASAIGGNMPALDTSKLLFELLAAETSEDYQNILSGLGDEPEMSFNVPFGPYGLMWKTLWRRSV